MKFAKFNPPKNLYTEGSTVMAKSGSVGGNRHISLLFADDNLFFTVAL